MKAQIDARQSDVRMAEMNVKQVHDQLAQNKAATAKLRAEVRALEKSKNELSKKMDNLKSNEVFPSIISS